MNRLTRIQALRRSLVFSNKFESIKNQVPIRAIANSKVLMGGFAKDFKPGPYPRTEAERVAAAKKYGLKPEDYEPFADDGFGYGDYPKLKPISTDMKSDFEEYDDPTLKRNFGETIYVHQEQITGDKVGLGPTDPSFGWIVFFFMLGGGTFLGLNYLLFDYKASIPIAPKQYPRNKEDGEKHYSI